MLTRALLDLPVWADIGLIAAFVLGGVVKGVLGVGVPLVLVPLMTQFLDPPAALTLISVPMVAANIGQSLEGGATLAAVRSLARMLVPLVLGTVIGVHLLISTDRNALNTVLGVIFFALAAMLLFAPRLRVGQRAERWGAPLVGLIAGLLGGVSAMFGPPMIAFQIGRGLPADIFIKQMAILAFTGSATLLVALGGSGAVSVTDFLVSAAAILPLQAGMPLGRYLRGRIPPAVFRTAVLLALAWSGLDLLRRSLF